MSFPAEFERWLRVRIEDGEAEVFREENFHEEAVPHCVTIEGGYVRLYAWTDQEDCSEEKVKSLRGFVVNILSENYSSTSPMIQRVRSSISKGKNNNDPIDPDDISEPENCDGDKPRVAFEIVSPRIMKNAAKEDLEYGLKHTLIIRTPSGDLAFRPEANVHWSGQSLEALKYIPISRQSQNLYSFDRSQTKSLTFDVLKFGDLYRDMIRPSGESIYASNVRGFLGRTLTNKRLEDAYRQIIAQGRESEAFTLFPFKNNGITLSCKEIVLDKDNSQIGIERPQIVNGQQTTRTWEKIYLEQLDDKVKNLLENISVVVKLVRLPNDTLIRDVAFSNNRQNPISADMLRSNEPVLVRIESFWNRLASQEGYPKFVRKVKRGDWISPRRIFEMDYYFVNGKRPSVTAVETFFDDGKVFDAFFGNLETLIQDPGYLPNMVELYKVWANMTKNNSKSNPGRKKTLNRAFGLKSNYIIAKHPFFAVGKPGWNLRVGLLLQATFQALLSPEDAAYWRSPQLFEGVAKRMLDDLKKFADARPKEEDEEDLLDNTDPELWDEWMAQSNRYAYYLEQVGLQRRGIVTIA
jgi:hypothetical protein